MGGAKDTSRILPQGMVRYLHLTGDWLLAEGFVKIGGVVDVVPPEELDVKLTRLPSESFVIVGLCCATPRASTSLSRMGWCSRRRCGRRVRER